MWCCSCFTRSYEAPEVLHLDYRHSSLNEVPPDIFTYERTLEKLDLGCNQISDLPPSLFHCHELRELDLCDNDLMCIPPAIGSLTHLTRLDLSRNAIADIADAIKNCRSLMYLDLSLNHLQKLPEGISQLVNLEELFLNDTYLEFLHANFGRLTKLKVLELRENSLQTLPKSMSRLHHLQRIDIGQNDISIMPEVIGTMANLVEIWCDNNRIRTIPKLIGNLTKLGCLDAAQNEIQEIAEEISKCSQLSDLTLCSNTLQCLPDSFSKLENLRVLRLDNNSIQYLPNDFGNLKNLQELSLIRNLLKGIPASIGLMRNLHTLYLDENLLVDLPKEIGSCSSLSILSLAKNRLLTIPSEIGYLCNLKVLTVSGNQLVHLPVTLLNIGKLNALWLSESQSKPLLPLNKEVEAVSGQYVLTCYLLPQIPVLHSNFTEAVEETFEDDRPRRSKPSIKFVTDTEIPPTECAIGKRGLLRAPTPYPKELRALAKHASSLRSKDKNGILIANNDEPEYEGDGVETDEHEVISGKLSSNFIGKTNLYSTNSAERTGTPGGEINSTSERSQISTQEASTQLEGSNQALRSEGNFSNIKLHMDAPRDERELGPQNEEPPKPPPYHVAARRAAFLRTATAASSFLPPAAGHEKVEVVFTLPALPSREVSYGNAVSSITQGGEVQHPLFDGATNADSAVSRSNSSKINASSVNAENPCSLTQVPYGLTEGEDYVSKPKLLLKDDILNTCKPYHYKTGVFDLPQQGQNCQKDVPASTDVESLIENKNTEESQTVGVFVKPDQDYGANIESTLLREEKIETNPVTSKSLDSSHTAEEFIGTNCDNQLLNDSEVLASCNSNVSDVANEKKAFITEKLGQSNDVVSKIPVLSPSKPVVGIPGADSVISNKSSVTFSPAASRGSFRGNINSSGQANSNNLALEATPALPNETNVVKFSWTKKPVGSRIPNSYHSPGAGKPAVSTEIAQTRGMNLDKLSSQGSSRSLGAPGTSSRIPKIVGDNSGPPLREDPSHSVRERDTAGIERTPSESRIPKLNDPPNVTSGTRQSKSPTPQKSEHKAPRSVSGSDTVPNALGSKIPTIPSRKPWIFGTHRNARVVPLEYTKTSNLGFTIAEGSVAKSSGDCSGIYVDSIETEDSTIKVGDKILQVDGIDVSNMGVDIVRKILSNCQENMHLLVSRQF